MDGTLRGASWPDSWRVRGYRTAMERSYAHRQDAAAAPPTHRYERSPTEPERVGARQPCTPGTSNDHRARNALTHPLDGLPRIEANVAFTGRRVRAVPWQPHSCQRESISLTLSAWRAVQDAMS